MNRPGRFAAGLALGFGVVLAAYGTVFCRDLGKPTESSRWCYEISQRKRQAAIAIPSPKLLLVGGSGTLFGISAREIRDLTGCPTVNLGTHAALGIGYMLGQVRGIARPGDTVLLNLEYPLYLGANLEPTQGNEIFVDYIVARDPAYFHSLSPLEQWNLFMLHSRVRLKLGWNGMRHAEVRDAGKGAYDVGSLNEFGDQTRNASASRPANAASRILAHHDEMLVHGLPENPAGFVPIGSFCKWAQSNQIRVVATFPNLCDQPEYHLPSARQAIQRIQELFAGLEVPVLGQFKDALLPSDAFFDTAYHLTQESRRVRTQELVRELAPHLKPQNLKPGY